MLSCYFLPYQMISQGVYSGLINSISTITCGICGLITKIGKYQNLDVNNLIHSLDLERRLQITESILNRISINGKNLENRLQISGKNTVYTSFGKYKKYTDLDPMEISLIYLSNSLKEIYKLLDQINKKVIYHQTKWFSRWRILDVSNEIKKLETSSILLEKRYRDLIDISFLVNNLGSSNNINNANFYEAN